MKSSISLSRGKLFVTAAMAAILIAVLCWRWPTRPALPDDDSSGAVEEETPIRAERSGGAESPAVEWSKVRFKSGEVGYKLRLEKPPKAGGPLTIKLPEGGHIVIRNEGGSVSKFQK